MNYQVLKTKAQAFIQEHHSYFWGVFELSMLCAAGYSVFGLILLSTGALASGNTLIMMLEFMIAPVYAAILFVGVTAALSVILTLPYAIALTLHLPGQPAAAATKSAGPRARKATSRKASPSTRRAKA
jgi:hypothetical protein